MAEQRKRGNTETGQKTTQVTGAAVETPVALDGLEQMITIAAYYRAERRGFSPGQELDDWLDAEREIKGSATGSGAAP